MLDISNLIALGSLFAALLAAVYAKSTVRTANKANEIAIHNERLKIYRGFVSFHSALNSQGVGINDKDLWAVFEHVELSEFYYSAQLYEDFQRYFSLAREIRARKDLWSTIEEESGTQARVAYVKETHEIYKRCLDLGKQLDQEFRSKLRVWRT